jgi:hypothetical protein
MASGPSRCASPIQTTPANAGWHVDVSFRGDDCNRSEQSDFSAWRVNVTSRGRALLMLFLFSDVGPQDAPTRIRVGSHLDMARFLAPAKEAGMSHLNLDEMAADRPEALATGDAGTVICVIPSLSTPHSGTRARRRGSWHSPRSSR